MHGRLEIAGQNYILMIQRAFFGSLVLNLIS